MLDAFIDWLATVPSGIVYAVLIVLSALENVFPPVPADVAVALGAFLSHRGTTDALTIGVSCWAANTLSAAMVYYMGRRNAAFFRQGWPQQLIPPAAMAALEQAYDRYGVVGIFISRFLPGVRAAVTPFAGIVGLSPARALVPAALASAIWYTLLVLAGTTLGREWPRVRGIVERGTGALGVFGLILASAAAFWIWRQMRRARRAA